MNHKAYQPKMPDRMEAVFDAAYLIFDLIAGILFFTMAQGRSLFILYGVLTLTLCGGDAFHLVPRIIRAVRGSSDRIKKQLGIGLQVSSITMTVFYIILLCLEGHLPSASGSRSCGSPDLAVCHPAHLDLPAAPEQLVYR